jgi:hypothetical protein
MMLLLPLDVYELVKTHQSMRRHFADNYLECGGNASLKVSISTLVYGATHSLLRSSLQNSIKPSIVDPYTFLDTLLLNTAFFLGL